MTRLEKTLDEIPLCKDITKALQQILGVCYNHQLEDILDRIDEPKKYGDDFASVDLENTEAAVEILEAAIFDRSN